MALVRELKRRLRAVVAPGVFLLVGAYFAWSATQGNLGLEAYARRQHDLAAAQTLLSRTEAEVQRWQQQVQGLRSSHLDLDALDERARVMLNRADPAEVIVPYGPKERLFK